MIKEIRSKQFKTFYDSECDENLVSNMIDDMESNCERIESNLKVKLDKNVEVRIYQNKKQFQNDVRLLPEFKNIQDWARGVGYFDSIYILLLDKTPEEFIKMAVHELVHVLTHKINASPLDRVPLLEGIATYMADYPPTDLKEEHLPNSIEELFSCRDVGHPDYLKKMYSCGYSFVKFIVENYGYDKFIDVYKKDYSNNDFDNDIRDIYKKWIVNARDYLIMRNIEKYASIIDKAQVNRLKTLINKSKEYMDKIDDCVHDHNHINDVVNFTIKIMDNIREEFDAQVCLIAAYWHDVGRTIQEDDHEKISAEMLRSEMQKLEYDEELIQKCYDAVIFHKWNMTPETIEGNIIRDADKLAWLGMGRWKSCLENNHKLDIIIGLLPRLKNEMLFFDYSRELYDEEIIKVLELLHNQVFKNDDIKS